MLLHLIFVVIGFILFLPLLYVIPLHLTKKGIFIIWFGALIFTLFSFITLEAFPVWQAGIMVLVLMLAASYLLEGRLLSQLFQSSIEHEVSSQIDEQLPLKKREEATDTSGAERTETEEKEPKGVSIEAEEDGLDILAPSILPSWEKEKSLQETELAVKETNEISEEDIDMDFLHKRVQGTSPLAESREQKEERSDRITDSVYPHYMSEIDELLFEGKPKHRTERSLEKTLQNEESFKEKTEKMVKPLSRYNDYLNEEPEDVWGEDDIIEIKRKGEGY